MFENLMGFFARQKSSDVAKDRMRLLLELDRQKTSVVSEDVIEKISTLSRSELMDSVSIVKLLGYKDDVRIDDIEVSPKGYRQLSKIPKTPINIIENMSKLLGDFQHIIRASIEELDDVEGIGEVRAKNIKQGIKRMHEQVIYDSKFYR